jgi:hypothetical protein
LLSSYSVPTLWVDIEEAGHALISSSCNGVPFSLLSSYSVPTLWEDIQEVGHALISSSCKEVHSLAEFLFSSHTMRTYQVGGARLDLFLLQGGAFSLLSSYSVLTLWEDIEETGHALISTSCKGGAFSLLSSYSVPTLWEDIE